MRRRLTVILISFVSIAIVLSLFVITYERFMSGADRPGQSIADGLFSQTFSVPIPEPTPVSVQPRRAAAVGALLISALLLMLYAHRPRQFILEWLSSWSLMAAGMYVLSLGYPGGIDGAPGAAAILEFSTVGSALLLFKSAHSFRNTTPYFRQTWLVFAGMLAWFLLAPFLLDSRIVLASAYLAAGWAQSRAAVVFAEVFREKRMVGALVLCASLFVVGVDHVAIGLFFGPIVSSVNLALAVMAMNFFAFLTGALGMYLLAFEDMTYELRVSNRELKAAQEELKRLATVDPLTGCYNRRFLDGVIERELQRHRRYGTPMSVLFADIDQFKQINDSYGHEVGDRVLQYVGRFLMQRVREADYVVRWGGDEFLLVLTCTGNEAQQKVEGLKAAFKEASGNKDFPHALHLSIGFAEVPPGATEILSLIREADLNMYADKKMRARA